MAPDPGVLVVGAEVQALADGKHHGCGRGGGDGGRARPPQGTAAVAGAVGDLVDAVVGGQALIQGDVDLGIPDRFRVAPEARSVIYRQINSVLNGWGRTSYVLNRGLTVTPILGFVSRSSSCT